MFRDTGALTVPGLGAPLAARPRPQAVQPGQHLLPRHRQHRHAHLQGRRRSCCAKRAGKATSSAGAATVETIYANGVRSSVSFGFPSASGEVGKLSRPRRPAVDRRRSNVLGLFVNDTWNWGKLTMNLGVRYDSYKGWLPEQSQLGGTNGPYHAGGAGLPGAGPVHLELVRAARRLHLRLLGRGPHGAEGQLRPVLAQPRRDARQRRQPEHRREVRDLQLERRQRQPPLRRRRDRGRRPPRSRCRARSA